MPTTLVCTGPVFTNKIIPALPPITNLRTIAFFGSGDDGNNGNRVVGGPAIVIQAGAPVYATNYVNLGLQAAGTRNDVLNTQNTRDATMLASGATWCAVCRVSLLSGGQRGLIMSDTNGTAIGNSWEMTLQSGAGAAGAALATGNVIRATIVQLTSPSINWHFYAMTYTGGAAGTFTAYDFTENATTGVPVTYVASGQTAGAQQMHYGGISGENLGQQPIEHAFGLTAHSVMSVSDMAATYQWAKANLARRSITI